LNAYDNKNSRIDRAVVKSSIADLDQRSGRGRIVQRAKEKPRGASQMPGDFLEIRPREFDPKSIAGLATEARE
jgi:hypothetical protein